MKTMYIECKMGAAGDMLTAALLELMPDREAAVAELNALGIPGVVFEASTVEKTGIQGTSVTVRINGAVEGDAHEHGHDHCHEHAHDHDHDHCHDHDHKHEHAHDHDHDHDHEHAHDHDQHHMHVHRGMAEIEAIINALNVSERVKADALAVYALIAAAESKAHGVPVSAVHFHEVGMMDAIADIVAFCVLMEKVAPDTIIVSPIHVGSGTVRCAHGTLPVPAPATAEILRGVPTYGGTIDSELCTPTGAALLKHFADCFDVQPVMAVDAIGYGMGKKDFPAANCVRVFVGKAFQIG